MQKKRYRSKFEKWAYVHGGGAKGLAEALEVNLSTVYTWFCRKRQPKLRASLKIVKLSKGKLTLKDIINGTSSNA